MDPSKKSSKAQKTVRYYNKRSKNYDSKYSAYLAHTHSKFIHGFNTNLEDRVLDVSAGTGILASELIQRGFPFSELVLNEPSKGMQHKARQRVGRYPKIRFTGYLAEELPFNDHSFDRIISLNSFHYYTHHKKVLNHIKRILKPGGSLYIQDWNLSGYFYIPNTLIQWFSSEHINTVSLSEMQTNLRSYGFFIQDDEEWRFRFWKFYWIHACIK